MHRNSCCIAILLALTVSKPNSVYALPADDTENSGRFVEAQQQNVLCSIQVGMAKREVDNLLEERVPCFAVGSFMGGVATYHKAGLTVGFSLDLKVTSVRHTKQREREK
jgi:hypothetical protein